MPRYHDCLPENPTPEPLPSPGTPTATPVHYVVLARSYAHLLAIQVLDQHQNPIENTYTNAVVEEYFQHCENGLTVTDWTNINSLLNPDGVYYDSVGFTMFRLPIQPVNLYDALAQDWLANGTPLPLLTSANGTQNIPVRVDGFELLPSPAISGRELFGYIGTYRVKIIWP